MAWIGVFMIKFLTSIIFISSSCFSLASDLQPNDSSLFLKKNGCSASQINYHNELVLNQYEFDDKLKNCCECTKLFIAGPIRDEIDTLLKYTYLTNINFSGSYVEDEELKKVCVSLTNLRSLDLTGSPITNEGLEELPKLKFLENLDITDTYINSNGVKEIPDRVKVVTSHR